LPTQFTVRRPLIVTRLRGSSKQFTQLVDGKLGALDLRTAFDLKCVSDILRDVVQAKFGSLGRFPSHKHSHGYDCHTVISVDPNVVKAAGLFVTVDMTTCD
jgi:hypothetical protein